MGAQRWFDESDIAAYKQAMKRMESWPEWKRNIDILRQYRQPMPTEEELRAARERAEAAAQDQKQG